MANQSQLAFIASGCSHLLVTAFHATRLSMCRRGRSLTMVSTGNCMRLALASEVMGVNTVLLLLRMKAVSVNIAPLLLLMEVVSSNIVPLLLRTEVVSLNFVLLLLRLLQAAGDDPRTCFLAARPGQQR